MTNNPVLFDLSAASCACTDHAIEELYKALSDDPGKQDAIWLPHENLYIQKHVENVTKRVNSRLDGIHKTLLGWLGIINEDGKQEKTILKALGWTKFTDKEFDEISRYLKSKPKEQYDLEDWMKVVDLIIHQYMPRDAVQSDAEYLAVRSVMAGRVQAQMDVMDNDSKKVLSTVARLPVALNAALDLGVSSLDQSVIESAMARAAIYITDLGEQTRKRIKSIIISHEEDIAFHNPKATQWRLQQKLLDEFGILNRDWRRVAITEVGENANQGFISYMEIGSKVKRLEAYENACPFCKKINGMVMTVVDPSKPDKDGWKEVWVGKTNIGLSAAPRKRVGDELIERTSSEMWWPASGVQHPNCRGRWLPVVE